MRRCLERIQKLAKDVEIKSLQRHHMDSESDSDSRSSDLPHAISAQRARSFPLSFASLMKRARGMFPAHRQKPLALDATDSVAILFFTAIGMIIRIFRIQFPRYFVFNEGIFVTQINHYLRGIYFDAQGPPLAAMIMASIAYYAGYKGDYDFVILGHEKPYPTLTYVPLRITSAFFGALCVPISYLIMRLLMCSHFASGVAGILVACDLMLIGEARHIMGDGIFHFFSSLAIFSVFLYERVNNVYLFVFEGVCLGLAISCKYTAGGIILLAIIRQLQLSKRHRSDFLRVVLLCLIILFVHFICFSIHLTVLPFIPDDNVDMPECVQLGLISRFNPDWDARSEAPSIVKRVISLFLYTHRSNTTSTNAISSPWYSWAVCMGKWIPFWSRDGKQILCMSNPLTWFPVLFGILINTCRIFVTGDMKSEVTATLFGYLLSYLPLALVRWNLPFYHYAIPLFFGCYSLTIITEREFPAKTRGFLYCLLISLAILGYFIWAPWAYGLTTTDQMKWCNI